MTESPLIARAWTFETEALQVEAYKAASGTLTSQREGRSVGIFRAKAPAKPPINFVVVVTRQQAVLDRIAKRLGKPNEAVPAAWLEPFKARRERFEERQAAEARANGGRAETAVSHVDDPQQLTSDGGLVPFEEA